MPNLQVLDIGDLVPLGYLSQFISSIRHTALLELVLDTGNCAPVKGPPTTGLAGLEKLSIIWNAIDKPNEPRSSLAHLYEFIRPTLTTLVKLKIYNEPEVFGGDFDLQLLKPTANTLRTFEYALQSADESILDTIPAVLPHLTKLSIIWDNLFMMHSILWKACYNIFHFSLNDINESWQDAHIQALSRNDNLTDLTLSSDFEVNAQDSANADDDYAWFVRCYERRLQATQDITSACPQLQRCSWLQMRIGNLKFSDLFHSFIVEERMSGGNVTRVVRGIKQHWMGRDHDTRYRGGGIVKCKLEDLPGDIIGRNDVE